MTRTKRILFFFLKLTLAVVVLAILFTFISPADVYASFRSASILPLAGAALLIPVQLGLRVGRWRSLLKAADEKAGWLETSRIVLVGYAFSTVTPAEAGDYIARSRMTSSIETSKVVALTLLDKLIHASLVLLIGLPALMSLSMGSSSAGVLAIIAGLLLVVSAGFARRRLTTVSFIQRIASRFRFTNGLQTLHDMPTGSLVRTASFGVGVLLVYVLQEYLLLNALTEASIVQTWQGFWAGMSVRGIAPIFLGDLGIREVTHVYFFGLLGISEAAAVSASLLMFTLNVFAPSIFGLILFLTTPKQAA
jgi:uncharacterized protein (TIRG00374 family)